MQYLITCGLFFCLSLLKAQVPEPCAPERCKEYSDVRDLALSYAQAQNYKQAMLLFEAAGAIANRFCNMNCDSLINHQIDSIFAVIDRKFMEADSAKILARAAEAAARRAEIKAKGENQVNRRFIGLMPFYDVRHRRFALAISNGRYGFIDSEGQTLINFDYDQARAFNGYGYAEVGKVNYSSYLNREGEAIVEREVIHYWLDTLGRSYRYAPDMKQVTAETEALDLNNLGLKALKPLFRAKALKVLITEQCRWTKLDPRLGNYAQMQDLRLREAQITELPPRFFGQMKRLRYLDLSHNQITRLNAESLYGLDSLEVLDLRHNALSSIDEQAFKHTPRLKYLYLNDNQLRNLASQVFMPLDSLILLDLQRNPLEDLPTSLLNRIPPKFFWGANDSLPPATVLAFAGAQTQVLDQINKDMVWIEAGRFVRGCLPERDSLANKPCPEETLPAREIELDAFYLSRYELTQAQWRAIMGQSTSAEDCDDCPIGNLSQVDALRFVERLNRLTKQTYTLPTEAQWEYAARGGAKQGNSAFAGDESLDELAWYEDNSFTMAQPVGLKRPNALGLYDMSGNVWEWCADQYSKDFYAQSPSKNPLASGLNATAYVLRGGSWSSSPDRCRLALRNHVPQNLRFSYFGLRLARLPK